MDSVSFEPAEKYDFNTYFISPNNIKILPKRGKFRYLLVYCDRKNNETSQFNKAFIIYIDDQYDDISVYEQLRLYCDDLSWIEDDEYYFLSKKLLSDHNYEQILKMKEGNISEELEDDYYSSDVFLEDQIDVEDFIKSPINKTFSPLNEKNILLNEFESIENIYDLIKFLSLNVKVKKCKRFLDFFQYDIRNYDRDLLYESCTLNVEYMKFLEKGRIFPTTYEPLRIKLENISSIFIEDINEVRKYLDKHFSHKSEKIQNLTLFLDRKEWRFFQSTENDEQYNTVRNFKNKDFYLLRKKYKETEEIEYYAIDTFSIDSILDYIDDSKEFTIKTRSKDLTLETENAKITLYRELVTRNEIQDVS